MKRSQRAKQRNNDTVPQVPQLFATHLNELKNRLAFIVLAFVVFSCISYAFFPTIQKVLLLPLNNNELFYLTPAGGLSFIIKTCMYVGLIAVLPVVVYNVYKFVIPALPTKTSGAVRYTAWSSILAFGGICFAYFVSLPAALRFLTNIELNGITQMLTVDSYISFVAAYIVAGALLFQLPLILLFINSVTTLPPQKLMKAQQYVIIGSFVVAAILSPTPDAVNQTIMAAPMVAMYQVGVVGVWATNRRTMRYDSMDSEHQDAIDSSVSTVTVDRVEPKRAVRYIDGVRRSTVRE